MLTLPELIDRPERPYAFLPFTVTMANMSKAADEGFAKLDAALEKRGIEPLSAPFFNYRRIDMERTLDIEIGFPVASIGSDGEDLRFGTLPAGRFACLGWTGPYDKLIDVTSMLIGWARLVGVQWDMHPSPEGDWFACRLEIFETDPKAEPDPNKWVTRLEFKTAP